MKIRQVFARALVLVSMCVALGVAAGAAATDTAPPPMRGGARTPVDPRVNLISPAAGTIFAPGDTINVVVELMPPLTAGNTVGAGLKGLTHVSARWTKDLRFAATFRLPPGVTGPLEIAPDFTDEGGHTFVGAPIVVGVKPAGAPKRIEFLTNNLFLNPKGESAQLYLSGHFAWGGKTDIRSALMGTTYTTSNSTVATVSGDGWVQAVGPGWAVITAANGGQRDFATVVVEDPAHPNPPIDLTDQVAIRRGPLRKESNTRVWRSDYQQVTITNTSPLPIPGALFLAVTGLPQDVMQKNDGRHRLQLPGQGLSLLPGQSVTVDLDFLNRGKAAIAYTAKVYHGDAD